MTSGTRARILGFVAFTLFLWCVPVGNWMQGHVGTHCTAGDTCVLSLGLGMQVSSGVVMVGVALVLRGLVQRFLGLAPSFIAVLGGALVTAVVAPPELVLASTAAILAGELSGLVIFTSLQRHGLLAAIAASALVGVAVDSVVFLEMAFGSLEQLPGMALARTCAVAVCLPFVMLLRRVPLATAA